MEENQNNCFRSKYVVQPFFMRARVSAEIYVAVTLRHSCLPVFRLTKGHATFFRPETIVASFLHSMVLLLLKVLPNNSSKRPFLVLHCHLDHDFTVS